MAAETPVAGMGTSSRTCRSLFVQHRRKLRRASGSRVEKSLWPSAQRVFKVGHRHADSSLQLKSGILPVCRQFLRSVQQQVAGERNGSGNGCAVAVHDQRWFF